MISQEETSKRQRGQKEKSQIRAYFKEKRGGVVVEVGANDPSSHTSQSLHLEDELGWTAVLVEPNPDLAHRAREERPEAAAQIFFCKSG
jgi:hypothetical protein